VKWEEVDMRYTNQHIDNKNRIKYIHYNPVKRGYIDEAKHWRYSSARDYEGEKGLIDIERGWFA